MKWILPVIFAISCANVSSTGPDASVEPEKPIRVETVLEQERAEEEAMYTLFCYQGCKRKHIETLGLCRDFSGVIDNNCVDSVVKKVKFCIDLCMQRAL